MTSPRPSPRPSFSSYLTVKQVIPNSAALVPSGRDETPSASPEIFASQSLWVPCGARGVFGGQVIAQSLVATSRTVASSLGLHSQHCYFLLPASSSPAIEFHVERLRDGRSYATRLVRAIQRGRVVFVLLASYTLPPSELPPIPRGSAPFSFTPMLDSASPGEAGRGTAVTHSLRFAVDHSGENSKGNGNGRGNGSKISRSWRDKEGTPTPAFAPRFQISFPEDVLPLEECEEEEERWQRFLNEAGERQTEKRRQAIKEYIQERRESPVSICVAKRKVTPDGIEPNVRMIWMRARLQPGEKPDGETVKAMIAYMTDFQFIGTAARSVGLTWTSSPRLGMLASLDHSTHFYPFPEGPDISAPFLHVMEGTVADVASGRGVVRGLVYTREGKLVASTLQEGVVRADLGKGEKGLVEGGGVGETGDVKERAKL